MIPRGLFIQFSIIILTCCNCLPFIPNYKYDNSITCPNQSIKLPSTEYIWPCFRYENIPSNFFVSQEHCGHQGGYLASPIDNYVNEFIANIAVQHFSIDNFQLIWLGCENMKTKTDLACLDGSRNNFTNFDLNSPRTGECLAMNISTSKWQMHDCNDFLPYVCNLPGNGQQLTVTPIPIQVTESTKSTTLPFSKQSTPNLLGSSSTVSSIGVPENTTTTRTSTSYFESTVTPYVNSSTSSLCPNDSWYYSANDSNCYIVLNIPKITFNQSADHCHKLHPNASLVYLSSQEEEFWLASVISMTLNLTNIEQKLTWFDKWCRREGECLCGSVLCKYENTYHNPNRPLRCRDNCCYTMIVTLNNWEPHFEHWPVPCDDDGVDYFACRIHKNHV